MRVALGGPKGLNNENSSAHLLDDFQTRGSMHPSAIVWLCVPLFYRRDIKHRVCQGGPADRNFLAPGASGWGNGV